VEQPDPLLEWGSFMEAVEKAIDRPGVGYGNAGADGFNAAGQHVLTLLEDAVAIYQKGSYGTAAFLAVTALEETAKTDILTFRRERDGDVRPKGRDPLRDHAEKHKIAVRPTVWMGQRLIEAIGRDRCLAIKAEVEGGGLTALREAGLYVAFDGGKIVSPSEAISKGRAREILLVALEAADDILVGSTNASYEWTAPLESLFKTVSG